MERFSERSEGEHVKPCPLCGRPRDKAEPASYYCSRCDKLCFDAAVDARPAL